MQIVNAKNFERKRGTYLIYGAPGMGKTSTARFFPGKTLILDIDRTSGVLAGQENIDVVYIDNIETFEDWQKTIIELYKNYKGVYDNIVVDNVSELERCILSDLGAKGKNKGVPEQGHYQIMQFKLVNSLRYMKGMGANVIWTAWETMDLYQDADGRQYNRLYPQLNQKILNNVLGLCDVVGKLTVNAEGKRGFVLQASNSIFAKNQLDDRKGCLQEHLLKPEEVASETKTVSGEPDK